MSLMVGELKGTVAAISDQLRESTKSVSRQLEHVNNNLKLRDEVAAEQRAELHKEIGGVKSEVGVLTLTIASVQQDVAEMKNDNQVATQKINEIEAAKPVVVAAIGDVETLKKFKKLIEDQQMYEAGYWQAIKKIGGAGWTVIAAFLCVGSAIFTHYGWPYVVDLLRGP